MTNLDIERIRRPQPNGAGFPQLEAQYRRLLHEGREIRIAAGKRAEYPIPAGNRAVVYVMEGNVRFEGDDTAAAEGDIVWFKPSSADSAAACVAVEADTPFRGMLMTLPREHPVD